MRTEFATPVFDRKHILEKKGYGHVEIYVYLARTERTWITVHKCTENEWKKYQKSKILLVQVERYQRIVEKMIANKEEMTVRNFLEHTGGTITEKKRESTRTLMKENGLIDFIKQSEKKEDLAPATLRRNKVLVESLKEYGKLTRFADLTPDNLRDYDDWLNDGTREVVSIYNYHKVLKKYARMALEKGLIEENPYDKCHFSRGKSKERKPYDEKELVKLRKMELSDCLDRVRDLFIFCAYTGLAYVDSQKFNFKTMTDEVSGTFYIDGNRVKTGSRFYTPILPPAYDVLKKYNFEVPKISNQKANLFLHTIEELGKFKKPMTMHIARHSFATLLLSHNVSLESVAKMMGHHDIRVTQIYAKLLNTTVHENTRSLISSLK